jgi:hypothetical protein
MKISGDDVAFLKQFCADTLLYFDKAEALQNIVQRLGPLALAGNAEAFTNANQEFIAAQSALLVRLAKLVELSDKCQVPIPISVYKAKILPPALGDMPPYNNPGFLSRVDMSYCINELKHLAGSAQLNYRRTERDKHWRRRILISLTAIRDYIDRKDLEKVLIITFGVVLVCIVAILRFNMEQLANLLSTVIKKLK